MGDAARPSDDEFTKVLQESLVTWSSYLSAGSEDHLFPLQAIDLKSLVYQTPPFLGDDLASSDEKILFACEEMQSTQGSLLINGRSTWRTSKGTCDLQPRILPKQLLLAVGRRSRVRFSEDSPLSDWPGVQGLSGYDKGNYLSVLYFAWAYILSARWVELLHRSADHECHMGYTVQGVGSSPPPDKHSKVLIDLGEDDCEEEVLWWRAILCSGNGWDATTKYNGHIYLSPWSVSIKEAGLTLATKAAMGAKSEPPSSATALKYLTRFCVHHRFYAQCSLALAGVLYIPFLKGRIVSLPFPKPVPRLELKEHVDDSITDFLNGHSQLLPKYMTLSSNPWGLRSLLNSTFFNPDIECNLVSAWLNPAFAVLDSIPPRKTSLVALLTNRQPRLGILWLGAVFTDLTKSILRDLRSGMVALDLLASAWTGTTQTFLTSQMGDNNGESIRRDDECRLLFITACEGHDRPPIWPWKPFGVTQICDTELSVRQHAQCALHCLEYQSWEWMLTNDRLIRIFREESSQLPDKTSYSAPESISAKLSDHNYDFLSQTFSEIATRGIFGWLRSTGYPRSERPIYQHSWFDLGTDEQEPNNAESDVEIHWGPKKRHVESWLDGIE
ncbi:uncharacterized protein N7482_003072 [Penicillium canariense]|uniref:Uncharacterized protein n=1 Tax=Penicillium canariense TaxID=189055 RepID=A0A9W9IHB9_9EURO|nr:uncharacterized protein N7482_003072 [Penicillium canariense]KAJ5177195.1 hypothetical protein N7482_003072 [Penicillium canariense]